MLTSRLPAGAVVSATVLNASRVAATVIWLKPMPTRPVTSSSMHTAHSCRFNDIRFHNAVLACTRVLHDRL